MEKIDIILQDATRELIKKERLSNISVHHILDRYFSVMYGISGQTNGTPKSYILKISTTKRTCENEYKQYVYLKEKKIPSLKPVLYSKKYNYLITKKECLIEFDKYLKKNNKTESRLKDFYKLGVLFKEIDQKTGSFSTFKKKEYEDYVLPRLNKLTVFSNKEKKIAQETITSLSSHINNKRTRLCFVSDFALGNFHLNEEGNLVLVDMGDAYIGNLYENIANIYLNIKFGSLNQFFPNETTTKLYFNEFVTGCGLKVINEYEFCLFKVRHLINMICFIDTYPSQSPNIGKRILAKACNKYLIFRYKSYLLKLCSAPLKSSTPTR